MSQPSVTYKRHRFPPQIIAHAVWLYYRFPLSLRLVEEMLLERGITVSYETIRRWGSSSDRIMPGAFVASSQAGLTGASTGWSSPSPAGRAGCGGLLIRMAMCSTRCPEPSQHQGCQAIADASAEKAGHGAEAYDHRQAPLLWSSEAADHAGC
jgi:putative transposase